MIRNACVILSSFLTGISAMAAITAETPEQALAQNRDLIQSTVASLNQELAQFTRTLQDEAVSQKEKGMAIKTMAATYMCGFPPDFQDLVPTLSNLLTSNEVTDSTKKWILHIFAGLGPKASTAEQAIEDFLKNGRGQKDMGMIAMASVAPQNAFFQERMKMILEHPEAPDHAKEDAALKLFISGQVDANILNLILKSNLPETVLLYIADQTEMLSDADRERFLAVVPEPTTTSYASSIKNYFRAKMQGDTSKAMEHFAESLTIKSFESATSIKHLNRLKKSEIKLLAPVLIDLMKNAKDMHSIAYLLVDHLNVAASRSRTLR